jgi:hypothetical protein
MEIWNSIGHHAVASTAASKMGGEYTNGSTTPRSACDLLIVTADTGPDRFPQSTARTAQRSTSLLPTTICRNRVFPRLSPL